MQPEDPFRGRDPELYPPALEILDTPKELPTHETLAKFYAMHPEKMPVPTFSLPAPPKLTFDVEKLEAFKQKLRESFGGGDA